MIFTWSLLCKSPLSDIFHGYMNLLQRIFVCLYANFCRFLNLQTSDSWKKITKIKTSQLLPGFTVIKYGYRSIKEMLTWFYLSLILCLHLSDPFFCCSNIFTMLFFFLMCPFPSILKIEYLNSVNLLMEHLNHVELFD